MTTILPFGIISNRVRQGPRARDRGRRRLGPALISHQHSPTQHGRDIITRRLSWHSWTLIYTSRIVRVRAWLGQSDQVNLLSDGPIIDHSAGTFYGTANLSLLHLEYCAGVPFAGETAPCICCPLVR